MKGSKQEVAEIKFLIHDLRVERFVNDILHFHTTLNTDLEIYNIEQAQSAHGEDLQELKTLAGEMRKAMREYTNAVRSFSATRTIIATGMFYIAKVQDVCELVLNPLWKCFDEIISKLPEESRSVRSRSHYRNYVRWLCSVSYRIEYFLQEYENRHLYEEFDVAEDIRNFTNHVIAGYVTEKSASKVDILFDRRGTAVVRGNKARFRRMFFNLVMNAVDAMQDKMVGVLKVRSYKEGKNINLEVEDNGTGMPPDRVENLLSKEKNLEGELHSLGFAFVQQTVREFNGELSVKSEAGTGTKVTVSIPCLPGKTVSNTVKSEWEQYATFMETDGAQREKSDSEADGRSSAVSIPAAADGPRDTPTGEKKEERKKGKLDRNSHCGAIIYEDYRSSEAQYPGCVFAISVNDRMKLDFFTHKPYEKYWNISHEDLSPMFFESTVRGRLEENRENNPELILKTPHSVYQYFEMKNLPEKQRNTDTFIRLMHDEYILIARKLMQTGMPDDIHVHATNIAKYFKNYPPFFESEPILISLLEKQPLSSEISMPT